MVNWEMSTGTHSTAFCSVYKWSQSSQCGSRRTKLTKDRLFINWTSHVDAKKTLFRVSRHTGRVRTLVWKAGRMLPSGATHKNTNFPGQKCSRFASRILSNYLHLFIKHVYFVSTWVKLIRGQPLLCSKMACKANMHMLKTWQLNVKYILNANEHYYCHKYSMHLPPDFYYYFLLMIATTAHKYDFSGSTWRRHEWRRKKCRCY